MKRMITILLLAALSLSLCACDSMSSVSNMSMGSLVSGSAEAEDKPVLDLFGSREEQTNQQTQIEATAPVVTSPSIPAYTLPDIPSYSEPVVITPPTQPTLPTEYVYVPTTTLGYWIEYCDTMYLNDTYLYGLSKEECRIARNAIYAKSGRIFTSSDLSSYFSQFSWYYPRVSPSNFTNSMLNSAQLHNLNVVIEYEEMRGY